MVRSRLRVARRTVLRVRLACSSRSGRWGWEVPKQSSRTSARPAARLQCAAAQRPCGTRPPQARRARQADTCGALLRAGATDGGLRGGQFRRRSRARSDIHDPEAKFEQLRVLGRRKPTRCEGRRVERGPESVPRSSEVMADDRRVQAWVDAAEQYPEPGSDEIQAGSDPAPRWLFSRRHATPTQLSSADGYNAAGHRVGVRVSASWTRSWMLWPRERTTTTRLSVARTRGRVEAPESAGASAAAGVASRNADAGSCAIVAAALPAALASPYT